MKIVGVRALGVPEVRIVTYARFRDGRGYFTETFRKSDLLAAAGLPGGEILQANESLSRAGVFRGLHAQWNPWQGKLVRALSGRVVDLAADIRKGSPTFGKVVAGELAADPDAAEACWMWIPPGFAHGLYVPGDSTVEYLCTGAWSQGCEISISPLDPALDWSLCDVGPAAEVRAALAGRPLLSDKDRDGFTLAAWLADPRSRHFAYAPGAPFDLEDHGDATRS
ncbi:MAG: dTDP-4-dehydrorhamnose 3,5-epimerase [Planctomycetes bacterium]|nr:dTDP-4-dehydrorhamnose 3,5-epimerase [Planctomycetota bacterium]